MNNTTAAIAPGPAFGVVLFGLARLFAHHPHVAAIAYTLFALGEVVPHVHSTHSSTTPQLKGSTNPPGAADHGAAPTTTTSIHDLVNETLKRGSSGPTVIVEDTPVVMEATPVLSTPAKLDLPPHTPAMTSQHTGESSASTSHINTATVTNVTTGADNAEILGADDVEASDIKHGSKSTSHDNEQPLQDLRILLVRMWYWLLSYVTTAIATFHSNWWQPYVDFLNIWVAGAFKQFESLPKWLSSLTAHERLKFPGQLHVLKARLTSCLNLPQPDTWLVYFLIIVPTILRDLYRISIYNHPTRRTWFERIVGVLYAFIFVWIAYDGTLQQHVQSFGLWMSKSVRPSLTPTSARQLVEYLQETHIGPISALDYIKFTGLVLFMVGAALYVHYELSPLDIFLPLGNRITSACRAVLRVFRNTLARTWRWLLLYTVIVISVCSRAYLQHWSRVLMRQWSELHCLDLWKVGAEWAKYSFDCIRDLCFDSRRSYDIVKHYSANLIMCSWQSVYEWTKQHWIPVVLSVTALILTSALYIKRQQIYRRSIIAIEVLCNFGHRSFNTIRDWTAWMTDVEAIRHRIFMAIDALRDFGQPKWHTIRDWAAWTAGDKAEVFRHRFIMSIGALHGFCGQKWHAIQEWNAPITEDKPEEILEKFKINRTPPPEVPSPADEEPAFEPNTQPEAPTPAEELPIPIELLTLRSKVMRKNKLYQQKIEALHSKKPAPKAMSPIVESQGIPDTREAVSPTQVHIETSDAVANAYEGGMQQRLVQEEQIDSENAPDQSPPQTHVSEANVDNRELSQVTSEETDAGITLVNAQGEAQTEQPRTEAGANAPSTTFRRAVPLDIKDFPLPDLFQRPTQRPATGVNSKEESRNRSLGGPSALTLMRREKEAAQTSAEDGSNSGGNDGLGDYTAQDPANSSGTAGLVANDSNVTGGAPAPAPAASGDLMSGNDSSDNDGDADMTDAAGEDITQTTSGTQQPIAAASNTVAAAANAVTAATTVQRPIADSDEMEYEPTVTEPGKDLPPTFPPATQSSHQPPVHQPFQQSFQQPTGFPSQESYQQTSDDLSSKPWGDIDMEDAPDHASAFQGHTSSAQDQAALFQTYLPQAQAAVPQFQAPPQVQASPQAQAPPLQAPPLQATQFQAPQVQAPQVQAPSQEHTALPQGFTRLDSVDQGPVRPTLASTSTSSTYGQNLTTLPQNIITPNETPLGHQAPQSLPHSSGSIDPLTDPVTSRQSSTSSLSTAPSNPEDPDNLQASSDPQASSQTQASDEKSDVDKFAEFRKNKEESDARIARLKAAAEKEEEEEKGRRGPAMATEEQKAKRKMINPKRRSRPNTSTSETFPGGVSSEWTSSTGAPVPVRSQSYPANHNPMTPPASTPAPTRPSIPMPCEGEKYIDNDNRIVIVDSRPNGTLFVHDKKKKLEADWVSERGAWINTTTGMPCEYARWQPHLRERWLDAGSADEGEYVVKWDGDERMYFVNAEEDKIHWDDEKQEWMQEDGEQSKYVYRKKV